VISLSGENVCQRAPSSRGPLRELPRARSVVRTESCFRGRCSECSEKRGTHSSILRGGTAVFSGEVNLRSSGARASTRAHGKVSVIAESLIQNAFEPPSLSRLHKCHEHFSGTITAILSMILSWLDFSHRERIRPGSRQKRTGCVSFRCSRWQRGTVAAHQASTLRAHAGDSVE